MQKVVALEFAIVSATLTAALLLMFLFNGVTVEAQNQLIGIDTASKSIIFDLKVGQHVSGSLNYSGPSDVGAWFQIYDPTGHYLEHADNNYNNHTGSFAFTASMDGEYWLYIHKNYFGTSYLDYKYTVSPAFLGLDKTQLISIVLAVGGSLAALTALNHRRTVKKKSTASK